MGGFGTGRDTFGTHPVAVLRDDARGRCVRIAHRGATVLSIEQRLGGTCHELADGYRDAGELESLSGSRFAVMAPFANRIAGARYVFDGVGQDMQPGVEGAQRGIRHGFVRGVDFEPVDVGADEHAAWVELATSAIRPGAHPGYPHAIDLSVRYVLDARGLALDVRMRNAGATAAPCFFGWHPYFRVGDTPPDAWELQVPADALVRTDADSIPLPGAAATVPLEQAPALDFRTMQPIGARRLDLAYAGLRRDADGLCRARLRDPASGLAVAMWQESGITLVFTADTVKRGARGSVALEPMESWSDAFNRPDCAGAIRLEPGVERRFRCGVEIELP
ncbi:aldose epimerase [Frateuria sp. Soil773]|uniref:aldose 1-epimerase n=1 Tax=Frateuria sp. Soil773 TaxID=1736407 RepID=UPI0006F29827|nr:aldose epimerase [Frateuria sp. Soil773]KRF02195.1 aldose epimerase [Frateuria sp. Soil773]